jgi:hypothetical protein
MVIMEIDPPYLVSLLTFVPISAQLEHNQTHSWVNELRGAQRQLKLSSDVNECEPLFRGGGQHVRQRVHLRRHCAGAGAYTRPLFSST